MAAVSLTFRAALPLVCTGTKARSERCAPYSNTTPTVKPLTSQLLKGRFTVCLTVLDTISSLVVPQFK